MSIALALHVLAVVIWVGGMFFAYMALRPAAQQLDDPQRLALWKSVLQHFFPWVGGGILIILASGYWMIFGPFNGMKNAPMYIHMMQMLGLIMMLLFMHIYFAPFRRLCLSVEETRWPDAAKALNQIRLLIAINLSIGLITIIVATAGKYY